jgi:Flp pilus assembly CpaF family ATPase
VHANSALEALSALVSAAMMAGENVVEPVVRRVFAASIDLVVHLGRDTSAISAGSIRRRVLEISAVASNADDRFHVMPIFVRHDLDRDLEWSGELPAEQLRNRIERAAGIDDLADICAGRVTLP